MHRAFWKLIDVEGRGDERKLVDMLKTEEGGDLLAVSPGSFLKSRIFSNEG